jgi:hypothetical protein
MSIVRASIVSLVWFVPIVSIVSCALLLAGCGCTEADVVERATTAANEKNAGATQRALAAAHLVVVSWSALPPDVKVEGGTANGTVFVATVPVNGTPTLAVVHSATLDTPETWARGDDGRLHRVDFVHDVTSSHDYEKCGCVWSGGGGAPPPPPPMWIIPIKSADELGAPIALHIPFEDVTMRGSLHGSADCPPPP